MESKAVKSPIQPSDLGNGLAQQSHNGYIRITNNGEIDINALLLLGATSKRGDSSKIGYFGSGLKYSLAVLLKNQIPFHIYSGEKEIKVSTTKQNFRGVDVDVIKVNNRLTSLTTDMGPDWEPWFAVRELYCNAIDEGNYTIGIAKDPVGEAGKTNIYVKFDYKLSELFSNWNLYFSDKRTDIVAESPEHGIRVFSGNAHKLIIYRKGVRCYEEKRKALYHYDLAWAQINESRVLASTWDLQYNLPKVWGKMANKEMIRDLFENYSGVWESILNWESVSFFNKNWLDVIDGRTLIIDSIAGYFGDELASDRAKFLILPSDIVNALKSYFGNSVKVKGRQTADSREPIKVGATAEQIEVINYAVEFLKANNINITAPIDLYEFTDNEQQMGEAKNGEIRISPKAFNKGRRFVTEVILEEHSHLISGAGDKTRAFQDFLLNELLALMERTSKRYV